MADALDGRSFVGIVLECGKTEGDADTIIFKGGRSARGACDRYDYGDGAYPRGVAADAVSFEARRLKARSTASFSGAGWCAALALMAR